MGQEVADRDVLQAILAAEAEGRLRMQEARAKAAERLEEARREVEGYRLALVDGIAGRLTSLDASLAAQFAREEASERRRADELVAAVEAGSERFVDEALLRIREELLGGR